MPPRLSTRQSTAARAAETWQQLIPNRPGVEDLLEAKRIPVAAIDANPEQPRKGPMRGIEELAESILEYGLLEPIVVTPPYSGRYVCLAGHRRLAAYDYLGKKTNESRWATIPAIERDTPTEDRLVLALLENVSRQDLSDAEKVTSFRLLHDLRGWSQGEIARRLGVSRPLITQYFRVASDSDVAEHVQTGRLGVAVGYEIVRAKTPDAKEAALDAAVKGAPKRVVRQLAHGREEGASGGAGAPAEDPGSADAAPGDGGQRTPGGRASRTVATAPLDAGVRDLAALADQLGLTVELNQLQLFKLMRTLVAEHTTTISLGQFLRLVRADVRKAEALVRAQPQDS
jgi:ParB family chromosome partitioning protein